MSARSNLDSGEDDGEAEKLAVSTWTPSGEDGLDGVEDDAVDKWTSSAHARR